MAEGKDKGPASLDLQIEVSNFGPISKTKAPVRVKPLTVFMGKSNTGKSYLAILLYALFKVHSSQEGVFSKDKKRIASEYPFIKVNRFLELIRNNPGVFKDRTKLLKVLKDCLDRQQIQSLIRETHQDDLKQWIDEIHRCIAPLNQLIRDFKSDPNRLEIILKRSTSPFAHIKSTQKEIYYEVDNQWIESVTQDIYQNTIDEELLELLLDLDYESTKNYYLMGSHKMSQEINFEDIVKDLMQKLPYCIQFDSYVSFHNNRFSDVYYFPAARTGVIQSHKAIVSSIIQRATRTGLSKEEIKHPLLSGGIADFLDKLISIDPSSVSCNDEIVKELETDVLKGQIEIKPNPVGYPDFIYKKGKLEIPMLGASSMVTELSPIVLYLKYCRRLKDTLIIEEPEAHLHPEAQKSITKTLITLIKSGVNVILTTHSDILLQEISNYRMSESVPEKKRKAIMGDNLCLSENEVAVYNFKPDKKGDIVVEHIPFDSEDGFSIEDHNEVSTQQYDQTIDIYDESHQHASKKSSK